MIRTAKLHMLDDESTFQLCVCGFKTLPQVPGSASHLAVSVSLGTRMPTRSI